jgi:hypothetical protein
MIRLFCNAILVQDFGTHVIIKSANNSRSLHKPRRIYRTASIAELVGLYLRCKIIASLNLVQLICHILHLAIMIISEYYFLVLHLQLSVVHYPLYSILEVVSLKVLVDSTKLLAHYNLSQLS